MPTLVKQQHTNPNGYHQAMVYLHIIKGCAPPRGYFNYYSCVIKLDSFQCISRENPEPWCCTSCCPYPGPKLQQSVSKACRPKAFAIFFGQLQQYILEIILIYNHINKSLHLKRPQKFYILQLFLHCFLHSTTWFWPKSTSNPKFYILQDFFTHFLHSTK